VSEYPDVAEPLAALQPKHDAFIGIDSDGCAFDSMEIKHKECFIPNIIKHWGLQPVSKYAREAAEFVNLYSKWRGINRWPALVMAFDLLRERPEVLERGVDPPRAPRLREFIADDAFPKSNDGLRAYMAERPDPELDRALAWTLAVNAAVADMVHGVPPFPGVRDSLAFLADKADMIVVSATPVEALTHEWEEHDIAPFVRVIAGRSGAHDRRRPGRQTGRAGQRGPLLPHQPRPRARILGAVPRRGRAPVPRGDVRRRLRERARRDLREPVAGPADLEPVADARHP
jgi:hypothetical protein